MPSSRRIICGLRPISSISLRFTEPRRKPQKPTKPLKRLVGLEGLAKPFPVNGLALRSLERRPHSFQWVSGAFGTSEGGAQG